MNEGYGKKVTYYANFDAALVLSVANKSDHLDSFYFLVNATVYLYHKDTKIEYMLWSL